MHMIRRWLPPILAVFALLAGACGAPHTAPAPAARVQIAAEPPSTARPGLAQPAPAPASPPAAPVTDVPVTSGNPDLPEVALVFNVGAGSPPALGILNTLASAQVPATFMVMGWLARKQPELVRSIAAGGFEIGSHGDEVADLTQVSDAAVAADLQSADSVLAPLLGHSVRPLWSPSAGAQDARVRKVAAGLGFDTLLWSVDSGDWRTDATEAGVLSAVVPQLRNGSIVVLHLDSPKSREATQEALPAILDSLRRRGLTPVTMSSLLSHLQP